ncbi:NAD(P)-binding domain [Trinorchestia longiramus]|nr:NAD(P)-binding domain [Trinorchestia longiramus]
MALEQKELQGAHWGLRERGSCQPWALGVLLNPEGGAFADAITIAEEHVMSLPDTVSFDDASCITVSYLTAYFALHHAGGLRENGSVFIHSVAGSLGWAATQLALQVPGVTVVGTAGHAKTAAAQSNGVRHVINNREDYVAVVKSVLPDGASVVLDCRGGPHLSHSLDILQPLGKVVLIGAKDMITSTRVRDVITTDVSPVQLIMNNAGVVGLHISELQRKAPAVFKEVWRRLLGMAAEGVIQPHISKKFPLQDAQGACRHVMERHNIGKVVLEI